MIARTMPALVAVGHVPLSPSRRLSAVVRHEKGERAAFVDLRLQVADGAGWHSTGQCVQFEADAICALVDILERAISKLSEV